MNEDKRGHFGMNLHHTGSIKVEARDIDSFWTIHIAAADKGGNVFEIDYYVEDFDEETMKAHATALQQGADSIRELFKKKGKPKHCQHDGDMTTKWVARDWRQGEEPATMEVPTRETVTTCDKCGETVVLLCGFTGERKSN